MKINKNILIHIIGIGGIGMSGIAEILSDMRYHVQGSDININSNILRLNKKNIKTFKGHKQENLKNVNLIVYSTAVKKSNVELKFAKKNKIPSITRAEILSQIVKLKNSIAVSGSHGKTTTTSLISSILNAAKMNPTVINGGIINQFGTNTRLGSGKWMVVEADESDGTFVKLPSTIAVVTNIDKEHLDFYKNYNNLLVQFKKFITQVPFYGFSIVCIDDPSIRKIVNKITTANIITYGETENSDIQSKKIRHNSKGVVFNVELKKINKTIKNISLPMHGNYNINNALAAIALASELNVNHGTIKKALSAFSGVQRRLTQLWDKKNIKIIDDYAHHPTEIKNVIEGLNHSNPKRKLIIIFQPHRYSRLVNLKKEFSKCFIKCDQVFVSNVYSAGEKMPQNFKLQSLLKSIKKNSKVNAEAYENDEQLLKLIKSSNDKLTFLFLGAGTVTQWASDFSKNLKKIYE